MKPYLIFILFSPMAFASFEFDLGYGSANVKGDTMVTMMLQGGYLAEIVPLGPGKLGAGGGLRLTKFSAKEFQAGSDDNEKLEDVNSISQNIYGQVHYDYRQWRLGFNIDFFGKTTGSASKIAGTNSKIELVSNNKLNGGKSDIGSLNSELFLSHHWDHWRLRFGTAHIVIEFQDDGLSGDRRRQRFFDTFFLSAGINY